MGDIKKLRKKYSGPRHPWQRERIESERVLFKEYGLKNKREIWVMSSLLAKFKNLAKAYISKPTAQSNKEAAEMLARLRAMGLLSDVSSLNDILTLSDKDIFERRLQTVVFRKGFARSVKQARQFISHGHITVDGTAVTSPSYIVKKAEEASIGFVANHSLANVEHSERVVLQKKAPSVRPSRSHKTGRGRAPRRESRAPRK